MKKILFLFLLLILTVSGMTLILVKYPEQGDSNLTQHVNAEETDREVAVTIESGDTFGVITDRLSIPGSTVTALMEAAQPVYDFTTIRAGNTLLFYFDHKTGGLKKVIYEYTTEENVVASAEADAWNVALEKIAYEIRRKKISGTIHSSLYETALENNLDVRASIKLAEMFAWQIDFAVDVREGDTFTATYEERYLNNEYIAPGKMLAATYVNDGEAYDGYYYKESDAHEGYFDHEGNSLQKIFLKSPLQYKYISSGFSSARYNPAIHKITSHYAIDYAANYGTPAVTVGEGTVTRAGWATGYGYSVDVRHNDTYKTGYGHFSRLAVKAGQKVQQGQIVGYVGSTGWSTGPHLHFELYKNGVPINPLTVKLPSEKGLAAENLPAFQEYIKQFGI